MLTPANDQAPYLRGLVTDQDLDAAEAEFPGITDFFARRRGLNRTFLDLLGAFLEIGPYATQH